MRKHVSVGVAVIFTALILAGVTVYQVVRWNWSTLPPQYFHETQSPLSTAAPHFDHVVVIIEENKPRGTIIGSSAAPYINSLARHYAYAIRYYAVTNPSLPNYIALTSGTAAGITNDCSPPSITCQANVMNIADRLEQAHKAWKLYAESMPRACDLYNLGGYAVRHNPFTYYPDIRNNPNRCQAHDVPFAELSQDLSSKSSLPDAAYIVPNLCDDMHNCSVKVGDDWLAKQVPAILKSPAFTKQHSLLVIVWDEGAVTNNNVAVIFAGPAAKQHYVSKRYVSHYSLLRTIEDNWQLKPLTDNDRTAPVMTDMLR